MIKGYQNIFSDQIKIKEKKDLIIFLSGSGNSKNIIKGISIAKKKKKECTLFQFRI